MKIIFEKYKSVRRKPANMVDADILLFKHEFEKEIKETHLVEMSNGLIFNDIIINSLNFKKYITYSQLHPIGYKSILKRLQTKRFRKITEGVWIIDNWSSGYFHWITDALPRLLVSDRINDNLPVLLPESYRQMSFVTESLNLLGKDVYFYNTSIGLIVKKIILPSHTANTGNYNHTLINELRDKFIENIKTKGTRKVFISRLKAPKRKISNEGEVVDYLKSHNWEIHYFEDYSFKKQIEIMSETKCLIGLHGAGLTNMLFMKEGGKVLELRNKEDNHNNCYFSLASELDIEYYYQLNEGNSIETHTVDIEVDMNILKKNIELMEP
jgi:capsular polysaccharide biosynthesis protein